MPSGPETKTLPINPARARLMLLAALATSALIMSMFAPWESVANALIILAAVVVVVSDRHMLRHVAELVRAFHNRF